MCGGWQAALGLILVLIWPSLSLADTTSSEAARAEPCSIAAGHDASDNTLTCYFGLTPEQLRQLAEVAAASHNTASTNIGEVIANICGIAAGNDVKDNKVNCTVGPTVLIDQIKDVSGKLDINQNAVLALLRVVGEDPNVPDNKLAETLTKVAEDYKKLQAQVSSLNPDNPTAKALVEQAKPEIDAGHFERAHQLLREAREVQISAAQQAYQLEKQARGAGDTQMLGAASSTGAEGDVAMTERRYNDAAGLFAQAADYVPAGHPSEQGGYLLRRANALYREGDERGDNAALENAAAVCQRALADYPRTGAPLDWAQTQNSLGNALNTLGGRESGTVRLGAAVQAYRAALEERTRERTPLDWATT
jgi:tetratricopeptide (TPR) repeat protein